MNFLRMSGCVVGVKVNLVKKMCMFSIDLYVEQGTHLVYYQICVLLNMNSLAHNM